MSDLHTGIWWEWGVAGRTGEVWGDQPNDPVSPVNSEKALQWWMPWWSTLTWNPKCSGTGTFLSNNATGFGMFWTLG